MNIIKNIPDIIQKEWDNRDGAVVLTTVSEKGVPNSIYATCVSRFEEDKFLVANNYFNKTLKNILSGSKGSILFITKNQKSFQLKGTINYYTSGKEFDNMKKWNPEKHPGHGVAVLTVEEIFSGSEKLY
ncbi:MAG: pyridoxamine 5'-phosphate oxidase family protein [Bacteroidales bacterium]|nr:pyridoxamine 5'-phosphate oxidase family protein [Bacteroidales bacterium]